MDRNPPEMHGKSGTPRYRVQPAIRWLRDVRGSNGRRGVDSAVIATLLAVAFAAGAVLAFDGLTRPDRVDGPRSRWARPERMAAFLRQAGVEGVSARDFMLVSASAGLLCGVVVQVALGWILVSLATATAGTLLPLAYLAPRRQRRRELTQLALVDLA